MRSITREMILAATSFFGVDVAVRIGTQPNVAAAIKEVEAIKAEVKKTYRKMCFDNHPDRGGDAEKLKEINAHYEIIEKLRIDPPPRLQLAMTFYGSSIIVQGGFATYTTTSATTGTRGF